MGLFVGIESLGGEMYDGAEYAAAGVIGGVKLSKTGDDMLFTFNNHSIIIPAITEHTSIALFLILVL